MPRESRDNLACSRATAFNEKRFHNELIPVLFLPTETLRVNRYQRLMQALSLAIVIDRAAAIGPSILAIVINDYIAPGQELGVKVQQSIMGRFVIIAVETHDGELRDLCRRRMFCFSYPP